MALPSAIPSGELWIPPLQPGIWPAVLTLQEMKTPILCDNIW
jgi:hypothetical protein